MRVLNGWGICLFVFFVGWLRVCLFVCFFLVDLSVSLLRVGLFDGWSFSWLRVGLFVCLLDGWPVVCV